MNCEGVSVALGIQHAMRTRCIILSSAVRLALSFFLHRLINGAIFGGGGVKLLNTKCMF